MTDNPLNLKYFTPFVSLLYYYSMSIYYLPIMHTTDRITTVADRGLSYAFMTELTD